MKHGSLFSGVGGFDLAAQWMEWDNVFQVEIDSYCQQVLTKNFPNVKRYGDIREFKGQRGSVDILTGGFPCQPFSHAGKREGETDDRHLWPEYLRIIREIQPTYVVGENVFGLVSMDDGRTLDGILLDLEGAGYVTEQFIIPACGVGAWHRRERLWIIAYAKSCGDRRGLREVHGEKEERSRPEEQHKNKGKQSYHAGEALPEGLSERNDTDPPCADTDSLGSHRPQEQQQGEAELRDEQECVTKGLGEDVSNTGLQRQKEYEEQATGVEQRGKDVSDPNTCGCEERGAEPIGTGQPSQVCGREAEPDMGGMATRIPPELDGYWDREPEGVSRVTDVTLNRNNRLKALGNAIVPQIAYELFKAIEQHASGRVV